MLEEILRYSPFIFAMVFALGVLIWFYTVTHSGAKKHPHAHRH